MTELKDFKLKLEDTIRGCEQVFIVPHLNADFDAIASAIGFSLISNKFSKSNNILMFDEFHKMEPGVKTIIEEYKNKASFIGLEKFKNLKSDNDLLIATDTNKSYLIGCRDFLNDFKKVVILDHHNIDQNTIKSDLNYIATNSSSASEIMASLLCQFGIKYDSQVANYLLSGIYLDTCKLNKGCSPKTFNIVSKLLEKGASLEKVQEYFAEDFQTDKKIQTLVQKTIFDTYTYAITIEDDDIIYTREDLAKAADKLLTYKLVDASFVVGKIDENIISISARSKGKVDVSKIMALLDGGGNVYSAATKIENDNIEEVGKKLTKTLRPGYITN